MSDLERLESGLRKHLQGKTLLGELAFERSQCDHAALGFRRTFASHGFAAGLSRIELECPILFALWLVNEAFYGYDGGYWPGVLAKVDLGHQNYSGRLGSAFVDILERFRLPRFRRLNTRWSYLGPILAHCGVPKSRLPQFFDRVLPEAARIGAGSAEGLAELQQQLPSLRVSRSIDWFIRFGDKVSADFVQRCLDMYNVAQAGGAFPGADAFGVPDRVWKEFEAWHSTVPVRVSVSTSRLLRPRLYLAPSQGVRLELPSQPCQSHPSLEWDVRVDAATPIIRIAPRFVGETRTEPEDLLVNTPFASAMVRLREPSGRELATWVLLGLAADRPMLFFDPQDFSVLPGEISAEPQGVLIPAGYSVRVRRTDRLESASVLNPVGRLPFGWAAFEASICDFTGGSSVVIADEAGHACGEIELGEGDAATPRLVGATLSTLVSSDRTRVFVGAAPSILIPAPRQFFNEQWAIAIDPVSEHSDGTLPRNAPASDALFCEEADDASFHQTEVPLEQPNLLGSDPWGVFDISVKGPLGQGARFRIAVVPQVRIEHDWSEWRQGTAVRTIVHTRAEVATATASVPGRVLAVERERTPLRLKCEGYGGLRWSIPVDLPPVPSWAVHDETSSAHLTTWSSQSTVLTLPESDGHSPKLLLRTATPWGIPGAATMRLLHGERLLLAAPVSLDANGYGKVDLQPFLANARQVGYPRVELRLDLQLARAVSLKCLSVERHWTVDGLVVGAVDDRIRISWNERFPMKGRVLRAHSRLTPWAPPRSVRIDGSAKGMWEARIADLIPEPGRYRLEIGVEDEWADTFVSAAWADWDHGTIEQWRQNARYNEPSVDGCLYHYLVNASDGTVDKNTLIIGTDERGEELSTKLFQALRIISHERAGVSKRLERLLSRVWIWPLLRGLIASGTSIEPRTLLELGLLAQARSGADRTGLSEHQADQIWRLWPPLGAWADLQAVMANTDRVAEARFVRWMGDEALRQLGPVATGSRLSIRDSDGNIRHRGQVLERIADSGVSPFDSHALRVVTLRVHLQGDSVPRDIDLVNGVWNDAADHSFAVTVRYSSTPSFLNAHPETELIELVNRGQGHILRGLEAHCKPFPTSPIGPEAFQTACFEWAITAAEQPGRRDVLSALCVEVSALARDVGNGDDASTEYPSFKRLGAELIARRRRYQLADEEPLLAVHQATWLVAVALVWRSLGRQFVSCAPHQLVRLSTTLFDLAPRLLAYDLMKVCAIEALIAAKAQNAARPDEAHE